MRRRLEKPASYTTQRGAQRYADELAALFPKRQFVPTSTTGFRWQVLVLDDGKPIALAGKRKSKRMRNLAAIHGALGDLMQE